MSHKSSILNLSVTIGLPDEFGEDFDYEKIFYYPKHHAWAGSYDRQEGGFNWAHDALFEVIKFTELCNCPCNQWLIIELEADNPIDAQQEIAQAITKINEFVAKFCGKRDESEFPSSIEVRYD